MKVPIYPRSINLRIQTDCKYDLTLYSLRVSKVVRRYDEWYAYITIEKEKPEQIEPTNILRIDLEVQ